MGQNRKKSRKGKKVRRLKWKEEKEEEFRTEWLECWKGRDTEENPDPEIRWKNIVETIEEAARRTGMTTKGGGKNRPEETWDNGEYKSKRRETFRLIHRFRGNRNWNYKKA